MGIDIGTTSLKAAVFDETGVRHGFCCEDYTLNTDPDSGFIEYDPEGYVQMCRNVIGRLRDECGPIDAISVDTQGETMVFADVDGKPLYPAIVWLDNRATQEADEIKERFGVRQVYEVTGQPEITAGWPACKALWFRKRHPELWSRTGKIFLLEDWILFRLTGNFVTEPTVQSSSIWLDITTRRWWPEMLDFLGLDAGMLPEIHRSGEVVGTYEGIPVVAGALDQIAGSIGAGVTDGRRVSEMTGTIMAICAMTDHIPAFREDSIIPCHLHAIEGKYTLILWSSTAGMALKWFKNQLAENFSFQDLDALAEAVPAGCDGLSMLPYFCGSTMPRYNPEARAVFSGINLSHTRGHFAPVHHGSGGVCTETGSGLYRRGERAGDPDHRGRRVEPALVADQSGRDPEDFENRQRKRDRLPGLSDPCRRGDRGFPLHRGGGGDRRVAPVGVYSGRYRLYRGV